MTTVQRTCDIYAQRATRSLLLAEARTRVEWQTCRKVAMPCEIGMESLLTIFQSKPRTTDWLSGSTRNRGAVTQTPNQSLERTRER
jgi:hypothetical protein